jgi:N-methylhydantoinase A/oxoprolinase/acetone carboxylase beta subunit
MTKDVTFRIAVDIGGTFTDCVVLPSQGQRVTTKALTTTGNQAQGVIDCLELAGPAFGISVSEMMRRTVVFVHGTTVGTNALAERRGARTGLLMTRGHEQAITIGRVRQKVMGLSEREKTHVTHLNKADPPIIDPEDIRGITERVDANGRVLVPSTLQQPNAHLMNLSHQASRLSRSAVVVLSLSEARRDNCAISRAGNIPISTSRSHRRSRRALASTSAAFRPRSIRTSARSSATT